MTNFAGIGKDVSFRLAAILAVSIMLVRLTLFLFFNGTWQFLFVDDILFTIASGLAALSLLCAAQHSKGTSQRAWAALAVAQIAFTLGEGIWTLIEVGLHQNPFPSLADVGFFMFYPIFIVGAGVFLMPKMALSHREELKVFLDAGIVIISAALVFWIFLIYPVIASSKTITLGLILSVAYPIMDMVLVVALMELLFRKLDPVKGSPIVLLAIALTVSIITDTIFCIQTQQRSYVPGSLLDTGWLVSSLLFGLAGVLQANVGSQSIERSSTINQKRAVWTYYLPYLGIGGAAFLIILGYESARLANSFSVAVSVAFIIGLMFIRQKITVDESNELLARTLTEIEERKRMQKDLQDATRAAEAATNAKSEFLANMSHEIRTPMNAVIGVTSLLLDENLTQAQREYVETIHNSGELLLIIINDILDLTKIESGKMQLDRRPFYLRNCLKEAMNLFATKASEKGLNLDCVIDANTPEVILGDPLRLSQVLLNLLSNAVKFTDKGEVKISVASRNLGGSSHEICFSVKDTGIGIPEGRIGHLFQPFSQVDASTARNYGGTGLGLTISKKLVELMGGKIKVKSEQNKGSIFHFTLMAEESSTKPTEASKLKIPSKIDLKNGGDSALRILLAEDNPVNQKVALQMLNKLGYKADVAADGLEVLQALESHPYDVVLMDVQMPEMDGLEAAKAIRKRWPSTSQPRIIALTAYALDGDRKMCFEAGVDDYMSKPIRMEELRSKLAECRKYDRRC